MAKILLSLCIPTYGMTKWIVPVLESIYGQGGDDNIFEVIISDNGKESTLLNDISCYMHCHNNIKYIHNSSLGFMNQINAFNAASGVLIKMLNHRSCLKNGALQYLLDVVNARCKRKDIMYFSNGVLSIKGIRECTSFSDFMRTLSYFASWSAGVAVWKEDYNRMIIDRYSPLYPHLSWLCYYTDRGNYVVDNTNLFIDITSSHSEKGSYNLFNAFGVEYVNILKSLKNDNAISETCFLFCKKDLEGFITDLYYKFVVCNEKCSYDLSGYVDSINYYYDYEQINKSALEKYRKSILLDNSGKMISAVKKLFEKIQSSGKPIYIYGAGKGGRTVYNMASVFDVCITGFVDRNHEIIKECCGCTIKGADNMDVDGCYIISVIDNADTVAEYIEAIGVPSENIYCFFNDLSKLLC